jgi:hypothetical protein
MEQMMSLSVLVLVIGKQEGTLRDSLGLLLPCVSNKKMRPVVVEVEWAGDEGSRFDLAGLAPFEQVYCGNPGDFIGESKFHDDSLE